MSLEKAVTQHMSAETDGSILVRCEGAFVARFTVTYDLNGRNFSQHSGDITVGVNKSVNLPKGSTNISLKVEEMWGFGWSTIFTEKFPAPVKKCYKVYGTTLDPKYAEISC